MSKIKDSGSTREFDTGAHRDNATGKGRCDLLPLKQVAEIMEDPVIEEIAKFMDTGDSIHLRNAIKNSVNTLPQYATGLPNMMLEVSHLYEDGALKYGKFIINFRKHSLEIYNAVLSKLLKYLFKIIKAVLNGKGLAILIRTEG